MNYKILKVRNSDAHTQILISYLQSIITYQNHIKFDTKIVFNWTLKDIWPLDLLVWVSNGGKPCPQRLQIHYKKVWIGLYMLQGHKTSKVLFILSSNFLTQNEFLMFYRINILFLNWFKIRIKVVHKNVVQGCHKRSQFYSKEN